MRPLCPYMTIGRFTVQHMRRLPGVPFAWADEPINGNRSYRFARFMLHIERRR
ncbi:MAG: hypothetical protein AAGI50_11605 [Pseudomonadota bacterium]